LSPSHGGRLGRIGGHPQTLGRDLFLVPSLSFRQWVARAKRSLPVIRRNHKAAAWGIVPAPHVGTDPCACPSSVIPAEAGIQKETKPDDAVSTLAFNPLCPQSWGKIRKDWGTPPNPRQGFLLHLFLLIPLVPLCQRGIPGSSLEGDTLRLLAGGILAPRFCFTTAVMLVGLRQIRGTVERNASAVFR